MKYEDTSPARRAELRFLHLMMNLTMPIERLYGGEGQRARELFGELSKLWRNPSDLEIMTERSITRTRTWLTELEQLLLGQRMLFGGSPVLAHFPKTGIVKVFRQLRAIAGSLPRLLEKEELSRHQHLHPSIDPRERVRPPHIRASKEAKTSKPKKAKVTFEEARNHLLVLLGRAGWRLSPALKIPHATSPDGNFRFWFKPRAILFSNGRGVTQFGSARSVWAKDYRFEEPEKFAKGLEGYAKKHR